MAPLRILIVDDSDTDAKLVALALRRAGLEVETDRAQDAAGMREVLARGDCDLVLSDWSMPGFSGVEALAIAHEKGLDTPVIIVSGTIGEETAVGALKAGARDFFVKDKLARLGAAVSKAIEDKRARAEAQAALARSEANLRRTQEQLLHAQKMEAIGVLAGGVAHDFNNLLSVILTYSEMGLRAVTAGEPLWADLKEIKLAGERGALLTRQLLAFSRKQVLELRVINLSELLVNISKMLRRLIGEDIQLAVLPAKDAGTVRADASQLEQVLMNLVLNARDAMPKGGKLTIEAANADLTDEYVRDHLGVQPGAYVMLAVSDTGIGMDKATQDRIFEPFFTTKEPGKGTGLGLSTVYGIVQQSLGHVWVYSEPGKGTTFKIYLPRTDESPTAVGSVDERDISEASGTETILLVEDSEQVEAMLASLLRSFGYHVLEARNAGEALLIAEKHPARIHLLLTDVVMPHMSGAELARRLGAVRPDMKVLCMSGYAPEAVLNHGIIDAGLGFIQKPITPDRLTRKIREILSRPTAAEQRNP